MTELQQNDKLTSTPIECSVGKTVAFQLAHARLYISIHTNLVTSIKKQKKRLTASNKDHLQPPRK